MKPLRVILFLAFVAVASLSVAQSFDFKKNVGGNTLYFRVSETNPTEVVVVCPEECNEVKDNSWGDYAKPSGRLVIPASVQYDGEKYAVTMIGDNAFAGCKGITAVTVPSSVVNIGIASFAGCPALKCFVIESDSLYATLSVFTSPVAEEPTVLDTLTLGAGVRVVPAFAFCELDSLKVINYLVENPSSFKYPFFGCNSEAVLHVGPNVTTIPPFLCYNFVGLLAVDGAERLSTIGENAFVHCTNLRTIVLPGRLECLGSSCFAYCTPQTIVIESDIMPWMTDNPFQGVDRYTPVYITCAARLDYSVSRIGRYFDRPLFREDCPDLHVVQMPEVVYVVDTVVMHDTVFLHDTVWMSDGNAVGPSSDEELADLVWLQKNILHIVVNDRMVGVEYSIYDIDGRLILSGNLPKETSTVPFKLKLSKKQRYYLRLSGYPPILLDVPNGLVNL